MATGTASCSEAAGGRDEIKTQFSTREGMYRLITLSDCLRPNRVPQNGPSNMPVRLSFVSLGDHSSEDDRICFNIGKELYFYQYSGVAKVLDLTRPLDKRVYRGTLPTCHDFNVMTAAMDHVLLIIGFSAGQIQLIDPVSKELSRLYNEERTLDKTKVTCIRWIPGSSHTFLASYASGQLYVYDVDVSSTVTLTSSGAMPHYQVTARGDAFTVYTCRAKTVSNPLQRWTIGASAINEFAFSPCGQYLAVVSADGYLRVFVYSTVEVIGQMRSYFGGLLCVAWSPDGQYIATGGEDDLITLWSFTERRVVCRGRGHRSWVGCVAFDPYAASVGSDFTDFCGSDDEIYRLPHDSPQRPAANCNDSPTSVRTTHEVQSYRLGSIGHDAMLCLWDITDEVLRRSLSRTRTSTVVSCSEADAAVANCTANSTESPGGNGSGDVKTVPNCVVTPSTTNVVQKFATLALGDRPVKDKQRRSASGASASDHRWHFSLASRSSDSKIQLLKAAAAATGANARGQQAVDDAVRLLGTLTCPRLSDVPMLVPLVGKRVAHERLTALVFREDCVVTSCYEGVIYTWARPGYTTYVQQSFSSIQRSNGNTPL